VINREFFGSQEHYDAYTSGQTKLTSPSSTPNATSGKVTTIFDK